MPSGPARDVLSWLGLLLAVPCALCLAVAALYSPEAIAAGAHLEALGLPVRPCPGCALCGLSRAFAWAMRGELGLALGLNPLVLPLFPTFWALAIGGPLAFLSRPRKHP